MNDYFIKKFFTLDKFILISIITLLEHLFGGVIMRGFIPNELMNAIYDKIYLDLEVHILNSKLHKAEDKGMKDNAEYLNKLILDVIAQRREVSHYLHKNGVKIQEPIEDTDGEFITYKYSVSINGGYNEGQIRFWRCAIRNNLQERMNKYFKKGVYSEREYLHDLQ
ncbi:hypothetical protein [Robertmurraya siralis]|uniref:hypothetical protein n=1 Tax=Robertmurraya siralis TaxID=77777 RepID=UPI0010F654BF|nr:hypothetical protein [Robertmurraya siralis]